jgi:hypothetical protein
MPINKLCKKDKMDITISATIEAPNLRSSILLDHNVSTNQTHQFQDLGYINLAMTSPVKESTFFLSAWLLDIENSWMEEDSLSLISQQDVPSVILFLYSSWTW